MALDCILAVRGIAKALKGHPPLSHKWYRVVGGEPDRRHLHRALYL
jgi:hypothetical protein